MHCEEFDRRFNELLDLRHDPGDDSQLADHAEQCSECASALEDWLRIERVVGPLALTSPASSPPRSTSETPRPGQYARSRAGASEHRNWSRAVLAASLAASLLGGVWWVRGHVDSKPPVVMDSASRVAPLDFQEIGSRVAQPEWWGSVVRAAWEPVDPLAEGFRPLTNSLQTAFELLTPNAGASTTVPSPLPEETNVGVLMTPPRLV